MHVLLCPDCTYLVLQGLLEYVPVQEEEGCQRLILCRYGDALIAREVREEGLHLGLPQHLRMLLSVKQDVPLDPMHIG